MEEFKSMVPLMRKSNDQVKKIVFSIYQDKIKDALGNGKRLDGQKILGLLAVSHSVKKLATMVALKIL